MVTAIRSASADAAPEHGELWVRSDLMPNGTYGCSINVGPDQAWSLPRDRAIAHAVACFAQAMTAEHDAALFTMLTRQAGLAGRDVAPLISRIRTARVLDHSATEPLRFIPCVGRRGPFLQMLLDGRQVGELTPADLRDHGAAVLNVLAAADLDVGLHRMLVDTIEVPDGTARAMIHEMADHWPAPQPPRRAS